jgi:predicted dehydrogenase
VTGLVSGHRDKAEKAAAEYNVPAKNIYNYDNFDEILDNKDIDAVYIALPNSMHSGYTIRAANAGKHVLCEKPMATNVRDSQAMIAACQAANVKLFIAYRCQYEPTNLKAIELIRSGRIGPIQSIESANGFNIKPGEWRLNKKLSGGGPMPDMGVYSINACRYLTGEEPAHLEGYASTVDSDGRFDTVEENVAWTMKFPSGAVATCSTTYGADMPGFYRVHGSKGMLHAEPAFAYQGIHLRVQIQGEAPLEITEEEKDPSQFAVQADEFAQCIAENREPKTNGAEGLRDMQCMEAIYKSAGISMS